MKNEIKIESSGGALRSKKVPNRISFSIFLNQKCLINHYRYMVLALMEKGSTLHSKLLTYHALCSSSVGKADYLIS